MKRFLLTVAFILAATILFTVGCTNAKNDPDDATPTDGIETDIPLNTTPAPIDTEEATKEPEITSEAPTTSPESTGGEIEDFSQGRVVEPDDVPDIVAAVEREHPGAKVQSITHALHLDKQVYEVIFTDSDGQQRTVYVSPDGSEVTESENPMATD